jgi:hypothetical protein
MCTLRWEVHLEVSLREFHASKGHETTVFTILVLYYLEWTFDRYVEITDAKVKLSSVSKVSTFHQR